MAEEYSDEEVEPDEGRSISRLLEPPMSFTQRQSPGASLYSRSYVGTPASELQMSTPKKAVALDSVTVGSAPRRRLSTSYTPLDSPHGAGPGQGSSWSGVSKPVLRRRTSSAEKPSTAAEMMTIFHQHSVLYPDECIPSSWAGGCSLKEAADVIHKLENLLIVAERNHDFADYSTRISENLRRIPGLLTADSYQDGLSMRSGNSATKAMTPSAVDSHAYSSPQRYIGSNMHGQLTPQGRSELLSGKKRCGISGVKHRCVLLFAADI